MSDATVTSRAGTPSILHRFKELPLARVAVAALAVVVVLAAVPPVRKAVALGLSKAILFVASPLTPALGDLDRLPQSTKVLAADGSILADLQMEQRREPVQLSSLPDHVAKATLAAEDEKFYSHDGVDPEAVLRAVVRTAQGDTQGGSTITQQLAKINYTSRQRTFTRKFKEVLYAAKLERTYSKDQLLERYLNQVYFGEGAYGINMAARTFFGTTADQLTVDQAATLAGKIRSPEGLDPRSDPERMIRRRNAVLTNMAENGWIDQATLEGASATPLELAPERPSEAAKAPHFVEYVKREAQGLEALGDSPEARNEALLSAGYTIETTLDPKGFDAATAAVQEKLGLPEDPATAVVSVEPGDGAIRNLFAGLTFERRFDVASQGRRQPGSSFKPFVYLAMLKAGIDPRSTFDASSPQTFEYRGEVFQVDNYEGGGSGQVNADDALVDSINTVYMRIGLEAGPARVVEVARSVDAPGEEDAIKSVAAVSLGGLTEGVTPLEMAAAYATFAAKGLYAEPYSIARITDRGGSVVYEREVQTEQVFKAEEVGVLNNATQRVVAEGTARAASLGRPVAGKTGTTQNYGDAWFVGYVPQLATAVWVGHPDRIEPMLNVHGRAVTGGSFPAAIFADTMGRALEGVPPAPLFTASPDDLGLRMLNPTTTTTTAPPPTEPPPSTTLPATVPTTPTAPLGPTTTAARSPLTTTTTQPGRRTTSTTSSTTTSSTTTTTSTTTTSTTTSTTTPTTTTAKRP